MCESTGIFRNNSITFRWSKSGAKTSFTNTSSSPSLIIRQKVSKGAKIKNRHNQVPHLTQDTNGKVTNSQYDTKNESQEVNPFPTGDHKAHINRRVQRHGKHRERNGSVVECLTPVRGAVGSSFTGVTALCP